MLVTILLIGAGLLILLVFRPQAQKHIEEMKNAESITVSDLESKFEQSSSSNSREFVELTCYASQENLVLTPFSEREVAYCKSTIQEHLKEGSRPTNNKYYNNDESKPLGKVTENIARNSIYITDMNSSNNVVVDVTKSGCNLDLKKSFNISADRSELRNYNYFDSLSSRILDSDIDYLQLTEETIEPGQKLYITGEAYKEGNTIHVTKPTDRNKPFIITTKSEDDIIKSTSIKSLVFLVLGIVFIGIGIFSLFM